MSGFSRSRRKVFEQQIAEIGGIQDFQPLLIELVELGALAVGESGGFGCRHMRGIETTVLPVVDLIGKRARRPALVVDVLGLQDLFQQPNLIVGIDDGEGGFQADKLGMPAQDLGRNRMERAEPGHAFGDNPGKRADPLLHFARRFVGESDGEDLAGKGAAGRQNMGDPGGENLGLACARAGKHQNRTLERFDRGTLLRIEPVEIAGSPRAAGPRRDPAGTQTRRL